MRAAALLLIAAGLLASGAAPLRAQESGAPRATAAPGLTPPARPLPALSALRFPPETTASAQPAVPLPALFGPPPAQRPVLPAPLVGLLSAAIPGAGEYALHLQRWVPRLAIEAVAWWQYREHRVEARNFERRYRALACQVARRVATSTCPDSSVFEYYEQMGKFWSSGSFDRDPQTVGVQPELDTTTFNGKMWEMAQRLNPGFQDGALAYYDRNAIPPGYVWNWGDNTLEQTVYNELLRRGDDSFRTSSRILGLILANHVTSAVDAFIAARLRELAGAPSLDVRSGFEPGPGPPRWTGEIQLGVGRRPPR